MSVSKSQIVFKADQFSNGPLCTLKVTEVLMDALSASLVPWFAATIETKLKKIYCKQAAHLH